MHHDASQAFSSPPPPPVTPLVAVVEHTKDSRRDVSQVLIHSGPFSGPATSIYL